MRKFVLIFAASCLPLVGCSNGPPEIPNDLNEAAQFCVAAKMLAMRDADGRQRGDLPTVFHAAQQQAYPMIAASKLEDFATFIDEGDLVKADQVVRYGEGFDPAQFDQLVSQCDAHFGMGALSLPTLPTDEFEAIYSCYAASHWVETMASLSDFDDEGRAPHYRRLLQRMEARKDLAVARRGGIDSAKSEEPMLAGLRYAFSQGNIVNYAAACDARFRG